MNAFSITAKEVAVERNRRSAVAVAPSPEVGRIT